MRTHPNRRPAIAVAAVAVAAVAVAEIVAWLIGPHGGVIDPDHVSAAAYFSAAQLDRAADFNGPQRLIGLGSLLVQLAVLALLALWRPRVLRSALATAGRRPLIGAAAVAASISLILVIAGLPLAAIGHQRARDFGLATQGFGPWLSDQARSAAVAAGLAAIGGLAAMVLIRRLGRRFWIGGTALVVAYAVIATWLAPVLLAPVFNDFQELPKGPTRARVLRLGREAGVDIGQVYRVDASRRSTALNAYVDGLGSSKRVVIYDNAIRRLSPAELDSIVAHELGHVKRDDIVHGIFFVALIAPLGVLFVQLMSWGMAARSGDDVRTPGGDPSAGPLGDPRHPGARGPRQPAIPQGRGARRHLRPRADPRPRHIHRAADAAGPEQHLRSRSPRPAALPLRLPSLDDGADRRRGRLPAAARVPQLCEMPARC